MCLLVVLHRTHPDGPLVVAANRDELLARPAKAMTVLRASSPRIVGGRDEIACGTWLAANEHGVVAGLTNLPNPSPDRAKKSRGELPIALAMLDDARAAAEDFRARFRPADYNPAWLLVGDRRSLFYIDMTAGESARVRELLPGIHVLENQPLDAPSGKVDRVRRRLEGVEGATGDALVAHLHGVLKSHDAACVHAGVYGTRSAEIVVVPEENGEPRVWFTDGPPCTSPLQRFT
jgi:uncharacterized protein with NRDE domain